MAQREELSAKKRMISARSSLMMNNCFFGTLAMKMKWVEDPTAHKMWTDMVNMGYNPEWVKTASHDELISRIAEITMHNSNGHSWRRAGRDPKDWNIACDRALWNFLKNAGFALPDDVHYDPSDQGQSAEKIYAKIHKPAPPQPQKQPQPQPGAGSGDSQQQSEADPSPGDGTPSDGQPEPQDGPSGKDPGSAGEVRDTPKEQEDQLRTDWQIATIQAATQAKSRGQLPAGLEQLLDSIQNPRIDWKAALRRFVQQSAKSDFTWSRPSRRYVAQGLYLPMIRSENMPPVGFGWDTSGSRDNQKARAVAAAEIAEIMRECKPEIFYAMYADSILQRVEIFEPDDPIEFHPKGGGGTSFVPFFEYLEKEEIEPACLIIITDLEGEFPKEAPSYPVIWLATTNHPVPFGEVLRIDDD